MSDKPQTREEKICEAKATGKLYTPTTKEWDHASTYQRSRMTWPQSVIDKIERERS